VRGKTGKAGFAGVQLDDVPDDALRDVIAPPSAGSVDAPKSLSGVKVSGLDPYPSSPWPIGRSLYSACEALSELVPTFLDVSVHELIQAESHDQEKHAKRHEEKKRTDSNQGNAAEARILLGLRVALPVSMESCGINSGCETLFQNALRPSLLPLIEAFLAGVSMSVGLPDASFEET
jgi:hypothetical protein